VFSVPAGHYRHMVDVRVVHHGGQRGFSVPGREFMGGVFFPKSGEIWFRHGRGLYAAYCLPPPNSPTSFTTSPLINADEADQEKEPLKKAVIEGGGATGE